jgi:hypothetical protein
MGRLGSPGRVASPYPSGMSRTVKQLRALTDDEVIAAHDQIATHVTEGVDYYLQELTRRESRRQTSIIVGLTVAIFAFTVVVAVATVVLLLRG